MTESRRTKIENVTESVKVRIEEMRTKKHQSVVREPRKAAEPSVRCDYCSRVVRGQARKRALRVGGPVSCSRCEREKRQG